MDETTYKFFLITIGLAVLLLNLYVIWTLVKKTGYSGSLTFIFLIPFVGLVAWLIFVFSDWPIRRELRRYKELHGELPEEREKGPLGMHKKCILCRSDIPPGTVICLSCGWTPEGQQISGANPRTSGGTP